MSDALTAGVDRVIAETGFSGVVHVTRADEILCARATGLADRARGVANTLETQFAIASGTKTLTALAVMALVAEGALELDAKVQSVLDGAADLVDRDVTVRQLLAHTSGMGDYLDEASIVDIEDYVPEVPVQRLAEPADFLCLLRGRSTKFRPGTGFSYCNSGYVLLALVIEAVSAQSYYDVVRQRVCMPAGMLATSFFRLDALSSSAAIGYLPDRAWRSNRRQLPVRGAGDCGAYSTAGDIARLWAALFMGRVVPPAVLEEMLRPQHASTSRRHGYGLGFWVKQGHPAAFMEGSDAGISLRSSFDPSTGLVCSVLSNTTRGAWPVVKELEAILLRGD
jgi:CubicO group peptidase (beta-lactamase class C family)